MQDHQRQFDDIAEAIRAMREEARHEWTQQREYNQQLAERSARIETNMHGLVGNGKPGRVDNLETAVDELKSSVNRVKGGAALVAFLGIGSIVEMIKFHLGNK